MNNNPMGKEMRKILVGNVDHWTLKTYTRAMPKSVPNAMLWVIRLNRSQRDWNLFLKDLVKLNASMYMNVRKRKLLL